MVYGGIILLKAKALAPINAGKVREGGWYLNVKTYVKSRMKSSFKKLATKNLSLYWL